MRFSKQSYFFNKSIFLFIEVVLILLFLVNQDINMLNLNLIVILFHSICLLSYYRRNQVKLIFIFFLLMYLVSIIPYFFFDKSMVYHQAFNNKESFTDTFILFQLFVSIFYFLLEEERDSFSLELTGVRIKSSFLFYCSSLLVIFGTVFGKTGETILTSAYGSTVSNSSPLYEYTLIFILMMLLTREKKLHNILAHLLIFVYCIKSVLYGGRIEVIMSIFMLFIIDYNNKFKNIVLIIFLLIGINSLNFFGDLRAHTLNNNSSVIVDNKYKPLVNNYTDVFHSSTVYSQVKDNYISNNISLKSFIQTIFSFFDPGIGFVNDDLYPSNYSRQYATYGGGGLIFAYFYYWFGIFGILIAASITALVFNKLSFNIKNKYFTVWILMSFATIPRWLVYSPILLIKINLYAVLLYSIFVILNKKYKIKFTL